MCCEGSKVTYSDVMPQELQDLRRKMAMQITNKIGESATQLPQGFPIAAQVNPLTMGAANMLSGMMGMGQYQNPGYSTYGYPVTGWTPTYNSGQSAGYEPGPGSNREDPNRRFRYDVQR